MSFVSNSNSIGFGARFHLSKRVALDVSYFKTIYHHYDKYQEDYNGIKKNFGTLLGSVSEQVQGIASGIVQEDMASGVDPTTDTRLQVISQLGTAMQGITAVQTPGHDRLMRTNDVIGIGVSVAF